MPLLSTHQLEMHHGGPLLLDGVEVRVEAGRCVGIVGRNGCGKTTLLRILAGQLEATAGRVHVQRGVRIGYQAQHFELDRDQTVREAMASVFDRHAEAEAALRALEAEIATCTDDARRARLLVRHEEDREALEADGVHDVDLRIERMLRSLGIGEGAMDRPLGTFSGGERNVIALARAILDAPDILLLDEPTNHLDLDGLVWFADFVRKSRMAFLIVSHDRHLLDASVEEIWELSRGRLTTWAGGYSDWRRQREEARALQERQYKVQQRKIERLAFQARRLMDMANAYDDPGQARRAKAMQKRIERMDTIEAPESEMANFKMSVGGARHGRLALRIQDWTCAVGDRVLLEGAHLEMEFGDRVCILGPNGSGKSTLLHRLLTEGGPEHPHLRLGPSVRVGEVRQFHDEMDVDVGLEDWMVAETGLDAPAARDLLHRFLFRRDDLERPVRTLSGGEKTRLQFARVVHRQVNLLVLDEPTNHLDVLACEELERMLAAYEGTLLLVSHDRRFLETLDPRVVELREQGLHDTMRPFSAWWARREADGAAGRRGALVDREDSPDQKAAQREAFEARQAEKREANRRARRIEQLEAEIEALEAEQTHVDAQIEAAYGPQGQVADAASLLARKEEIAARLIEAMEAWEAMAEA